MNEQDNETPISKIRPILFKSNQKQFFEFTNCSFNIRSLLYPTPRIKCGCGSVSGAADSNSRGPLFESSHWQQLILNIYCQLYWKHENKEKEAGNGALHKMFADTFDQVCNWITAQVCCEIIAFNTMGRDLVIPSRVPSQRKHVVGTNALWRSYLLVRSWIAYLLMMWSIQAKVLGLPM